MQSHPVLSAQRNLGVQFHLECIYISLVYYDYQPAKEHMQRAQQLCGLNTCMTGGRRREGGRREAEEGGRSGREEGGRGRSGTEEGGYIVKERMDEDCWFAASVSVRGLNSLVVLQVLWGNGPATSRTTCLSSSWR